ncbi:FG-GAP-like repeat-containing protein, partial [Methylobacterium tarhaniae]|uniref:beta strand repeat-containing protein n=1 Tax=Methylobacterium tarhaniae TaxID=1187852 RepID=UPI003D015AF3
TPQLTLATGGAGRAVDYTSGSGTNSLTFTYTVQAGDTSADLDVLATTALALNGGTIKDAAGNAATLTLAAPGAAGSLGAAKAITVDTTAPTVTGVSASTADGTYKAGDTISLQVGFSEAVTVTGTPQLTLATGGTGRAVDYTSGSGTNSLTFTYTVQAGDTSADLDVLATTALALNGGTIKDAAGNAAALTLAAPGAAGSLGAAKAIIVDTTAPTVTGVSASTFDGHYKAGVQIALQVDFSEAVTVTGTPQLTLATGGAGRTANYIGGSGTSSLTFTYTVQAGDTSADLDVIGTTALALNGGTIKDAAGNAAALTLAAPGAAGSLGAAKAIVIDTTAPDAPVITTPVAGTLTNDSTPTITGTAEAGSKVQILVDGRMAGVTMANDAGVFSIEGPKRALTDGPHTISAYATDAAGNQSADSASVGLTVDTTPPTAPRVTSGTAYTTITPTLTGVAEANATVTIKEGATLLGTVTANADGTWSLPGKTFAAGAHTLALTATDAAGNASTTTFALTTSQPFGFTGASATRQDPRSGPLKAGDSLAITLATAQTVTGVTLAQDGARPSLTLSNGATASYAGFNASGLQFTYTVQVGDDTADLKASSLALAGATIEHATPDGFQTSSSTGTDLSRSAEAADVDGDGKLDLITTGYNGGTVSVRLGNGDGTFKGETKHATGVGPTAVAAADLNGDGKVDLVTANDTAGHNDTVSVLLGNGDGTFRSKLDFAVGENPYAVMTADVNGDGKRDLLTVNQDDDTVSVLLGNGDGTFQAKAAFETGAFPTAVAAADLNRDGKIDLVATNTDEGEGTTVSVLLGNGDGTFQTKVDFTTGAAPRAVTAVDVNGDGKHDLVVANRSGNSVSVLLGNGDGTFQAKADFAVGKRPGAVAAVDVDQDGKIDLVTANRTNNDISVLLGNGDGTFRAGTSYMTGTTPYSLTATDLNADGRPDFLVSTTGDNGITVLLSTLPTRALLDSSSLAATSLSVAVDTTAPGAPVITTPVAGTLTNDSTPTITGTAEAGSEITILIDGNPIRATTASETGTFTFELPSALIDGAHTISARATDAAGNTSADATPVGLTVDATAPAAPRVTSGSHYTTTAPTLTGVAEANASVTIKEGATLLGTVTANADGIWSLPGKTFAAGAHTLALTATDAAGNASTTTFALTTSQPFGFTGASATRQQPGSGPLKA